LAASSDGRDAAVLLGAAEAVMEAAGVTFGPAEERLRAIVLSGLRVRYPEPEIEELVGSGRGVEAEDAVALARSYLG
jgi:hypothetical protein